MSQLGDGPGAARWEERRSGKGFLAPERWIFSDGVLGGGARGDMRLPRRGQSRAGEVELPSRRLSLR